MEFKKVSRKQIDKLIRRKGYAYVAEITPREDVSIKKVLENLDYEINTAFDDVDLNSMKLYMTETDENHYYYVVFKGRLIYNAREMVTGTENGYLKANYII